MGYVTPLATYENRLSMPQTLQGHRTEVKNSESTLKSPQVPSYAQTDKKPQKAAPKKLKPSQPYLIRNQVATSPSASVQGPSPSNSQSPVKYVTTVPLNLNTESNQVSPS